MKDEINLLKDENKSSQIIHENISCNSILTNENNEFPFLNQNDDLKSNSNDENKLFKDDDSDFKSYINNNLNITEKKEEKYVFQIRNENKLIKKINKNIKPIFKITKVNKLGRTKKNESRKGKHNKLSQDNVIRRFKVQFINNLLQYVNSLFKINNYGKSKTPINIIKKTNSIFVKSINKEDNLKWLDTKLKDTFSQQISTKLSNFDMDYNKKLLERIYEKNEEKNVIKILQKTIKDMLFIYINNDPENEYPGFKTLKDDIKKFNDLGETEAYIEMYDLVAKSFEMIFSTMTGRKKRKYNKSNGE